MDRSGSALCNLALGLVVFQPRHPPPEHEEDDDDHDQVAASRR